MTIILNETENKKFLIAWECKSIPAIELKTILALNNNNKTDLFS